MWIEHLDVRGFGRLRDVYRFAPGLTLVVGDNEAGKSTLHQALIRAVFGFSKKEQMRRDGVSAKDRCAPWTGHAFGLTARVREVRGRSYRIEWDFRAHALRLFDDVTGEDLSGELQVKKGEVPLGRFLLGLDLAEFRDVCCLDQAAVEAVERTENLVLALQQAVESRAREVGVEAAVDRLEEFLRTEVGVHTLHLKPLAKGRLAGLEAELAQGEEALERCEAGRAEVARLAGVVEARSHELEAARAKMLELDQRALLGEAQVLRRRLDDARALTERAATAPANPVRLPERTAGRIRAALVELERAARRVEELAGQAAAVGGRLRQLEVRSDELTARVDALEAYAATDERARTRVLELKGRRAALRSAQAGPPPPELPVLDSTLAAYRAARPRLVVLEQQAARAGWGGARALLAALAALGAAAMGWAATGASSGGEIAVRLAVALVLVILAAALLRRARPQAERLARRRSLEEALMPFGASSVEELDLRAARETARVEAARTLAEDHAARSAEARGQLAEAEAETLRLLDAAGVPVRAALDERLDSYLIACQRRAERAELARELEAVRAEIAGARDPLLELARCRRAEADLLAELGPLYAELGIEAGDLERARGEFLDLERRVRKDRELEGQAAEAQAALAARLDGETLGELAERAARAERRYAEDVASRGRLAADGGERGELEEERKAARRDLHELELDLAGLRTRIEDRERELADPAELRERVEELRARIAALAAAAEAIVVARDELRAAAREAHRAFAPHLNAALQRHLPAVTGGRYRHAVVDEDLQIQVEAPETGKLIAVDTLSRGTQDQIYLIERLEIVRLLDPTTGEAPLLLDDPFARFDDGRLRRALEVLREVARERQVILFSEDPALHGAAVGICPDCAVIRLPPPPLPEAAREQTEFWAGEEAPAASGPASSRGTHP